MMNKKLRQFLAGALVGTSLLSAAQAVAADDLVPYVMADQQSDAIKKLWGRERWKPYETSENGGYVRIAEFKNSEGEDVQISMRSNRLSCAKFDCPLRIFVSGELIFNDLACRFEDKHTLSKARNAVFLCDTVVPLVGAKELENVIR